MFMVAQNKLGKHGLDVDFCKIRSFQQKGLKLEIVEKQPELCFPRLLFLIFNYKVFFMIFLLIFCKINLNIKFSLDIHSSIALYQKISLSIVVCLDSFSTCSCGGCSLSSLINIIYFTSCCTTTFRSRFLGRTSIKLGFIFKSKLISIIDLIWVLEAHLILDGQIGRAHVWTPVT